MGKEFRKEIGSICVFCGSSDSIPPVYYQHGRQFGRALAERQIALVYGGGKTGVMGALADGVLERGGQVIGVVPEHLNQPQLIHSGLSRLEVTSDIQVRKKRMNDLADAVVALPGGYGTFDEFFEVLTWAQIGLHNKPIGLLNVEGYFDPLLVMVEHARAEGFIYPEHRQLLTVSQDPSDLIDRLLGYTTPPGMERWVNR